MTDDLKAPERVWAFDRYVNGVLMAEGVTITRASSFEEACVKATKLASRGPHDEAPVLVLAHRDADRIATLEAALADAQKERDTAREWLGAANNEFGSAAWDWPDLWRRIAQLKDLSNERWQRAEKAEAALADMTQQRDAAMAGAVKVKPLVWVKHPSVDIWRADTAFGTYKVFGLGPTQSWDFDSFSDLNDKTSKSAESVTAAKAAAQADYEARILSALTPDPDRMLALTAAAYTAAAQATFDYPKIMLMTPDQAKVCAHLPAVILALTHTDATAALSSIEAQAEARGWNNAMLTAITHVAEIRNAHTPGPIFKALNEAMGKIDDARFAGLRRYQTDATEAAAKGGV